MASRFSLMLAAGGLLIGICLTACGTGGAGGMSSMPAMSDDGGSAVTSTAVTRFTGTLAGSGGGRASAVDGLQVVAITSDGRLYRAGVDDDGDFTLELPSGSRGLFAVESAGGGFRGAFDPLRAAPGPELLLASGEAIDLGVLVLPSDPRAEGVAVEPDLAAPDQSGAGDANADGDMMPCMLDADDDDDGISDADDGDDDGDGLDDSADADSDGDGFNDMVDVDDDNDGMMDAGDDDADGNMMADRLDMDSDHDGMPDRADADDDNDGMTDAEDADDDGDGVMDGEEHDADRDGACDQVDPDDDADGMMDGQDADDDNDGMMDAEDDDDHDGVMPGVDPDDDNDGMMDDEDGDDMGHR